MSIPATSRVRQRGAALLVLFVVLIAVAASVGAAMLRRSSAREPVAQQQAQELTLAADALRGRAFQQRCLTPALPADQLLPCPDAAGTEGQAGASCPGLSRGWLPWRTLGLPPLRDASGTCLWYERQGTSARVIAAGAATATQIRTNLPARPICGGNNSVAQYLDAADAAVSVTLDLAVMAASCP
jgi:hypothetical protein